MAGKFFAHATAEVSPKAKIGDGTKIWHSAQVRENADIGENCIIGKNVYIDFEVKIGKNCKIQNNCSVYHGSTIEEGVFLGPHCVLTNDRHPRAVNNDLTLKAADDWKVEGVTIRKGAALGAGTIAVAGVTIGEWAMTGSGSVVTKDVPPHAIVAGNPAALLGFVCKCGQKLDTPKETGGEMKFKCAHCKEEITLKKSDYKRFHEGWIG